MARAGLRRLRAFSSATSTLERHASRWCATLCTGALQRKGLWRLHAPPVSPAAYGQPIALLLPQALANFADHAVTVRLIANTSALESLGLVPAGAQLRLRAPAIDGFQSAGSWEIDEELTLQKKGGGRPNKGYLFELS